MPEPPSTETLTPWLGAGIAAGKAVRGGERDARAAPARLGTLGIGDPGTASAASSAARARSINVSALGSVGIEHVEIGPVAGDLVGLGEPAERVLGHGARHRQGALDQLGERLRRAVARRHDRLPPADEDAQAEVLALRALELLDLAEAPGMRQRDALEQHRVGGIGAGLAGAGDEILQQVEIGSGFRMGLCWSL